MEPLASFLHDFPALCLFLSVLLGHLIGRVHVKGVGFGSVVGTLIAGIAIGIVARPDLPELLRWTFFYLFLFSVGYSVGPQFFGSLKKEALPQIVLAVVVAVSGLATVVAVTLAFGFDEGLAVGLLSGGMTQSAALGTGLSAITELDRHLYGGRNLTVNEAKPMVPRGNSGGFGGGRQRREPRW